MLRTTIHLAGAVLITLLAAIAVSGIQLGYVFMPPVLGTVYEITITVLALLAWYHWRSDAFKTACPQRMTSVRLVIVSAVCLTAILEAQQYWLKIGAAPEALAVAVSSPWGVASTLLAVGLTAPLLEEALFRGFLLSRLRARSSTVMSVAVSSAVFALAHADSTRALTQLAAGVLFATIVIRTGRLWLAVAAHSATNLSGLLEGGALLTSMPARLGLLHPALWLTIAVIAALEVRRILIQTPWRSRTQPHHGVAAPVTWNPDPIL